MHYQVFINICLDDETAAFFTDTLHIV